MWAGTAEVCLRCEDEGGFSRSSQWVLLLSVVKLNPSVRVDDFRTMAATDS